MAPLGQKRILERPVELVAYEAARLVCEAVKRSEGPALRRHPRHG